VSGFDPGQYIAKSLLGVQRRWFPEQVSFEDDQRVVHLFRNRAELKKSFTELQDEIMALQDKVKQEQASTARVEDLLDRLEGMLADPLSGQQALLHYQLRDLWRRGSHLLGQLAAELVEQQTEREHRTERQRYQQTHSEEVVRTDAALMDAENRAAEMRLQLAQAFRELAANGRWWHYWRRRHLQARYDALTEAAAVISQAVEAARAESAAVRVQSLPRFGGLSVAARRGINLTLLAYAQLLSGRLAGKLDRGSWLKLSAEAARRREPSSTVLSWDESRCRELMEQALRLRQALPPFTSVSQELKRRIDRLAAASRYGNATDSLPDESSLTAHQDTDPDGGVLVVLQDNDWDVRSRLLD
jgi:hypothetical protein